MTEQNNFIDVEELKQFLETLYPPGPEYKFVDVPNDDGSTVLFGPFGTFIFFVNNTDNTSSFFVSVNGNPNNTVFFLLEILKRYPQLQHMGAYSEKFYEGGVTLDEVEIEQQEKIFTLQRATVIQQELIAAEEQMKDTPTIIMPEEKKIVLH